MNEVYDVSVSQPTENFIRRILESQSRDTSDSITMKKAQDIIAYCARVSNPSNQGKDGHGLLRYCVRKRHWSIFEMVNVVLEINCSRTIGRQILRHRSFSFQEFSQRYANPTDMKFYRTEARLQDTKNRQNSIDIDDADEINRQIKENWILIQDYVVQVCSWAYNWAIEHNVAKEQARDVLPEGLTPSRMYMNGTLRSWIHYCLLRMGNGTQKEHQEVARNCWKFLVSEFPFLKELEGDDVLDENGALKE